MSVMDDVAALRRIASNEIPMRPLREVQQHLLELNAILISILGPDYGAHVQVGQRYGEAGQKLEIAVAALQVFESAIHDAADKIQKAGT